MAAAWAIEATYEDVYPLIYGMARKFQRQYYGDIDWWLSEANYAFMLCYYNYNREYGTKFSTWLFHKLNSHLKDAVRKRARARNPIDKAIKLSYRLQSEYRESDLRKLMLDLSEDGCEVLRAIQDLPTDITLNFFCQRQTRPNWEKWHRALFEFCYDAGWSLEKIASTFKEIREALS